MGGHDPSRFDYLFEPIGGSTESAGNGDVAVPHDAPIRSGPKRSWPWMVVVAATVLGAGVASVAVWSTPVDAVQTPPDVTTTAPSARVATNVPVVASVTESAPVPDPPPESTAGALPEPEPALVPSPASVARETPAARPPSPTVRSPMSVSPAPRPAFPNQQVPDGDGPRGGLLGRGGLL